MAVPMDAVEISRRGVEVVGLSESYEFLQEVSSS